MSGGWGGGGAASKGGDTANILFYIHVRLLRLEDCTHLTPAMTAIDGGHQKTRYDQRGRADGEQKTRRGGVCGLAGVRAPPLRSETELPFPWSAVDLNSFSQQTPAK